MFEHSYRPKGAWGLPGGSLESTPGDPTRPSNTPLPDDVIQSALCREMSEELGIDIKVNSLLRIDAIPYLPEVPGPFRLHFYFRCAPQEGFAIFRARLSSGHIQPRSPEIKVIRYVPLTELHKYDIFSTDLRFLNDDLSRLEPALATLKSG